MAQSCIFTPLVGKKPSTLYQDLLNITANNRPVSNFIYALASSKEVQNLFTKKDFNSQNELKVKALQEKFDIEGLIPNESKIKKFKQELNAIDKKGEVVLYDTPYEVYDNILQFNNAHQDVCASIKRVNNKYYIEVETIGAHNYLQNYYYRRNQAAFNALNTALPKSFNTSPYTKKVLQYFNFLTLQNIKNFIFFPNKDTNSRVIYNEGIAELVKFWLSNHYALDELRKILDEDQINKLLIHQSQIDPSDSNINIDDILESKTEDEKNRIFTYTNIVLSALNGQLNNLNVRKTIQILEEAEATIKDNKEYFGVPSSEIKDILNNLYTKFHLNTKDLDSTSSNITSLKELAEKLLRARKKNIRFLRDLDLRKEEMRELKKLDKLVETAEYGQALSQLLYNINDRLTSLVESPHVNEPQDLMETEELSAKAFRDKARYLREVGTFLEEHESDLIRLKHIDVFVDTIDDKNLFAKISNNASKVLDLVQKLKLYYVSERYNLVYNFLKLYWGKEDIKGDNDVKYSLKDLIELEQKDPGLIDRFILSLGECKDPVLSLVYKHVLESERRMIDTYRKAEFILNEITEKLYNSGKDSRFCYEFDEKGVATGRLISNIDWNGWTEAIKRERKRLESLGTLSKEAIDHALHVWKLDHTENKRLFEDSPLFKNIYDKVLHQLYGDNIPEDALYENRLFSFPKGFKTNTLSSLTPTQLEYYYTMMAFKSILSREMPMNENKIFKAVQIAGDTFNQIQNSKDIMSFVKNKVKDVLQKRETDTDYGNTVDEFDEMLAANGIVRANSDANNYLLNTIPILFDKTIEDKQRLSTNMSQAMNAWVVGAIRFEEMNDISDALALTQDLLLDHQDGRKIGATKGNKTLLDIFSFGKDLYADKIVEKGNTRSDALLTDWFESKVYGRRKKDAGTLNIFGTEVSIDKAADLIIKYTSFTGLSTNVMGAQANYLVGKLQMIIESGCGEFFGLKDYAVADVQYFQMLPELLLELNSNNKKSLLALLGNFLNVTDDYLEKSMEKTMNKELMAKILSNPNLFFLYGLGEHPLHFQTMLAVLNHTKVRNKKTGVVTSILKVFSVELSESGKNGLLKINTDDYEVLTHKDKDGKETYSQLTMEHINRLRAIIKYCNNTMHGAFGDLDRGMAHRYAGARLGLNFRQWMPAHYARRFLGKRYFSDLGEFRRGYYVSLFKFIGDIVTDKNLRFNIKANWESLADSDKYNIKRACTEVLLYTMLCAQIATLGTYKDKKGNWAYRNLQYQLRRLRMETGASMPGPNFINNALQILNSPIPAISALEKAATLFNFTNLYKEVEGGKHRGENLYLHKLEMSSPLYGQFRAQILDFATEDYLFNPFEKGY